MCEEGLGSDLERMLLDFKWTLPARKGPKRSAPKLHIILCVALPTSGATPACFAPQNPAVGLVVLRASQLHSLVTDGHCAAGGGCFKKSSSYNSDTSLTSATNFNVPVFAPTLRKSPIPAGCPTINYILTLSTWRWDQIPKVKGSVPQDCPRLASDAH